MAFSLEKALQNISERNTPEQRAEMEERSKDAIGRIDVNSPNAKARRNSQLEAAVLEQIAFLENEPESELKSTRMAVALDRLGELRAEQGDYIGAIEVTHDPKRKAVYEQIQQAIERPDNEVCECSPTQIRDAQGIAAISPISKVQTILTENGPRNLERCAKCGFLNAK